MNVIELFQTFQTQEQAIDYLEKIRWAGNPRCPYCGSINVGRHASGDRSIARWQCRDCARAFAVTVGTLFHGTHKPLRDWFLVLALMLNLKETASAYQIARDLGMRRPTVWSMMQRIRAAMVADPSQVRLLHSIVEADETYISFKSHKGSTHSDDEPNKRGGGGVKTSAVDSIERSRRAVTRVGKARETKNAGRILENFIDSTEIIPITDKYRGYARASKIMLYTIVYNIKECVLGEINIESFWSQMKCVWYETHYHYSWKHRQLHIPASAEKFNDRKQKDAFGWSLTMFIGQAA